MYVLITVLGGGCEGTEKDDPIQPGVGAANIQQTT